MENASRHDGKTEALFILLRRIAPPLSFSTLISCSQQQDKEDFMLNHVHKNNLQGLGSYDVKGKRGHDE